MTQLWLVPTDTASFQATLATPIDLTDAPDRPPYFPSRTRVWGVRTDPEQGSWERNKRNLERMESGDPLLFYRNGTGEYRAIGEVGHFWHTTYVRDEYWNGGPAIDVYEVRDYSEIDLPREEVNDVLNYEESFTPQGLWRVADDRPTDQLLRIV